MITTKQRSVLRSMANTLEPIFQIGKGGINDNFIGQIDDALEARELIKITLLKTAEYDAKEAALYLAPKVRADIVQCIGRKLVLFRHSKENPQIRI